jgi:hypothetical protein
MSILFAALFIAIGAGIYWGVRHWNARPTPAAAPQIRMEEPAASGARAPAPPNPYQKLIEVTGIRLVQNPKKAIEARFLIVNHSPANLSDMTVTVTLRARGASGAAGTISFKLPSLGGYESKELTAPVQTKLRVYELPDWQNLETELHVTTP